MFFSKEDVLSSMGGTSSLKGDYGTSPSDPLSEGYLGDERSRGLRYFKNNDD